MFNLFEKEQLSSFSDEQRAHRGMHLPLSVYFQPHAGKLFDRWR